MRDLETYRPGTWPGILCSVGSRPDPQAIGGYAKSDNAPRLVRLNTPGTSGRLSIIVLPREVTAIEKRYRGFRVLVVNKSGEEITFPALNSALKLVREARLPDGSWLWLDEEPRAFCGNSIHNVFLPPGHYWELAAPVTSGTHRVTMRFRLLGTNTTSAPFDGQIEPWMIETARHRAQSRIEEMERWKRVQERQSRRWR